MECNEAAAKILPKNAPAGGIEPIHVYDGSNKIIILRFKWVEIL